MWQIFILRGHPRFYICKCVSCECVCVCVRATSTIISATFYSFDVYTQYFHISFRFRAPLNMTAWISKTERIPNESKERRGTINARRVLLSQYFIQIDIVLRKIYKYKRVWVGDSMRHSFVCHRAAASKCDLLREASLGTLRLNGPYAKIVHPDVENIVKSVWCVWSRMPSMMMMMAAKRKRERKLLQFSYFVGGKFMVQKPSDTMPYWRIDLTWQPRQRMPLRLSRWRRMVLFATVWENCSDVSNTSCIWSHSWLQCYAHILTVQTWKTNAVKFYWLPPRSTTFFYCSINTDSAQTQPIKNYVKMSATDNFLMVHRVEFNSNPFHFIRNRRFCVDTWHTHPHFDRCRGSREADGILACVRAFDCVCEWWIQNCDNQR